MKFIPFNLAVKISLIVFGMFIIFHFAIISGILFFDFVPIDYLWGGRMETQEQLLGFEFISLLVIVFCYLVVLVRSKRIFLPKLLGASRVILWILFVLFFFNTLGNIFAQTNFEKLFAIVTAVLAILCLRMALEKVDKNPAMK